MGSSLKQDLDRHSMDIRIKIILQGLLPVPPEAICYKMGSKQKAATEDRRQGSEGRGFESLSRYRIFPLKISVKHLSISSNYNCSIMLNVRHYNLQSPAVQMTVVPGIEVIINCKHDMGHLIVIKCRKSGKTFAANLF